MFGLGDTRPPGMMMPVLIMAVLGRDADTSNTPLKFGLPVLIPDMALSGRDDGDFIERLNLVA